jgi:hypothetical protein
MGSRNAGLPLAEPATERMPERRGVLTQRPRRRAAEVWRIGANPGAAAWPASQFGGARPGTRARPRLRSWPRGRRSGCSSAEPYPPPRPKAIVAALRLGANHPIKLSVFVKPGSAPGCDLPGSPPEAAHLAFGRDKVKRCCLSLGSSTLARPARASHTSSKEQHRERFCRQASFRSQRGSRML